VSREVDVVVQTGVVLAAIDLNPRQNYNHVKQKFHKTSDLGVLDLSNNLTVNILREGNKVSVLS
jgi:hypothetical protein